MGRWRSRWSVGLLALVALLSLAACSSGGGSKGGAGAQGAGNEIKVEATDNKFSPATLSAPSGKVTVTITNTGKVPHTFTIQSLNVDTGNIDPGQSKTVTFTAPDSPTEFVCTIHLASDNMKGTISKA